MILKIHSDASHLLVTKSKTQVGGFFYLGDKTKQGKEKNNGPIHVECSMLKMLMVLAAETEIEGLFVN